MLCANILFFVISFEEGFIIFTSLLKQMEKQHSRLKFILGVE